MEPISKVSSNSYSKKRPSKKVLSILEESNRLSSQNDYWTVVRCTAFAESSEQLHRFDLIMEPIAPELS